MKKSMYSIIISILLLFIISECFEPYQVINNSSYEVTFTQIL